MPVYNVTLNSAVAGGSAWGDITGDIANQTDLQSALDSAGGYWDATIVQDNEQTVTNSTTWVESDDLQLSIGAGEEYEFRAVVLLDDNLQGGGGNGEVTGAVNYDSTVEHGSYCGFCIGNNSGSSLDYDLPPVTSGFRSKNTPEGTTVILAGVIKATGAGTLKINFAQAYANASSTAYLRANSYLRYREIV